jgi:hypothetical protein
MGSSAHEQFTVWRSSKRLIGERTRFIWPECSGSFSDRTCGSAWSRLGIHSRKVRSLFSAVHDDRTVSDCRACHAGARGRDPFNAIRIESRDCEPPVGKKERLLRRLKWYSKGRRNHWVCRARFVELSRVNWSTAKSRDRINTTVLALPSHHQQRFNCRTAHAHAHTGTSCGCNVSGRICANQVRADAA